MTTPTEQYQPVAAKDVREGDEGKLPSDGLDWKPMSAIAAREARTGHFHRDWQFRRRVESGTPTPESHSQTPDPGKTKIQYLLRERADHDGYTLLRNGIMIAGGSFRCCIDALNNEPPPTESAAREAKGETKPWDFNSRPREATWVYRKGFITDQMIVAWGDDFVGLARKNMVEQVTYQVLYEDYLQRDGSMCGIPHIPPNPTPAASPDETAEEPVFTQSDMNEMIASLNRRWRKRIFELNNDVQSARKERDEAKNQQSYWVQMCAMLRVIINDANDWRDTMPLDSEFLVEAAQLQEAYASVRAQRDDATAKLAEVERERDALRTALEDFEKRLDSVDAEHRQDFKKAISGIASLQAEKLKMQKLMLNACIAASEYCRWKQEPYAFTGEPIAQLAHLALPAMEYIRDNWDEKAHGHGKGICFDENNIERLRQFYAEEHAKVMAAQQPPAKEDK